MSEGSATAGKTFEEVLDEFGILCWRVVGASMLPFIREGRDVVVVRKRPPGPGRFERYDAVLFRRPGVTGKGAYVLHRILKVNGDGTYWIVGDNCVDGETVREEDVLGVLAAVSRGGRTVDLGCLPYRLYVRLWCAPYPVRFLVLRTRGRLGAAARRVLCTLSGTRQSREGGDPQTEGQVRCADDRF